MKAWLGVDFSGNHLSWRPGKRKSNVWICELQKHGPSLVVGKLWRVQDLPGPDTPFNRLARFASDGAYSGVAIDAPFSIPKNFLPDGRHNQLLKTVALLDYPSRPFPEAKQFVAALAPDLLPNGKKLFRKTESDWMARRVNVRSTMWAGPRGGAAFTAACVALLGKIARPIWPWADYGRNLLVEAFPAAQLREWRLPYERYNGDSEVAAGVRDQVLSGVLVRWPGLDLNGHRETFLSDADAMDSLLCAFAAVAVTNDQLTIPPDMEYLEEGWIAVHR